MFWSSFLTVLRNLSLELWSSQYFLHTLGKVLFSDQLVYQVSHRFKTLQWFFLLWISRPSLTLKALHVLGPLTSPGHVLSSPLLWEEKIHSIKTVSSLKFLLVVLLYLYISSQVLLPQRALTNHLTCLPLGPIFFCLCIYLSISICTYSTGLNLCTSGHLFPFISLYLFVPTEFITRL